MPIDRKKKRERGKMFRPVHLSNGSGKLTT